MSQFNFGTSRLVGEKIKDFTILELKHLILMTT